MKRDLSIRCRAALLALGLAWITAMPARAADVSIMPVNVHLDRQNDRATVQVVNNGNDVVVMQAEAIAWTRQAGQDLDAPTQELIVNPPIFTLQPGQTQILRLGLRRTPDLQQEATYRMVLREVPVARASENRVSGQVRVLVALRVPVYVAPNQVRREQAWQVQRTAGGETVATVSNNGNVHMKVSELRLAGAGGENKVVAVSGAQSVIFPGEQRTFRIATPSNPSGTLQVMTDQGLQHVALGAGSQ
jgi:fimbrial chaperone protein